MKRKLSLLTLILIFVFSLTMGVTSFAGASTFTWADWASETKSGASVQVGDATWTVGGYNKDYYRGLDTDGNLAIENVVTEPSFKGGSDLKVKLDGFSTTFKIKPAQNQTSLAAGAHVMIGLSNAPSEQNWPQAGFIFQMQKNGYFALYLGNGGFTYVGDGVWNTTDEPDNVLNRLRNSSGQEVALNIGLDDEIKLEIKYMTATERTAYGLQHAGYPAYALLINDCAYYYLPGTDNLFYPCNGAWCGAVENGIAYSYLSVFGNTAGDYNPAIPTPAEIATLAQTENVGMRITFSEIFAGYDYAAWATETKSGANVQIGEDTWTVGGYNKDYYRGLDTDGNLAIENVATEPSFKGGSDKKVKLDGFSTTFKILPAEGNKTIAVGAHVMIGLSNAALEQNYPQAGFVFQMQESGNFALYLTNSHYGYVGDSVWNQTDTPDDILKNLKNSSGQDVDLELGLNDEIKLEIKFLTAADRAAYGLQHSGFSAYAILVNDNAYYYLPNTDNKFYNVNGTGPDDGSGYSYLSVFGNTAGEVISAIPSPSEIATLSATENVGMRITFSEIVTGDEPIIPDEPETTCDCCDATCDSCICEKDSLCDKDCTCSCDGCIVAPQKTFTWADWTSETKSGASVQAGDASWIVGGYNKDYYRGLDADGNLAIENVATEPSFKGGSDLKVKLDGFSTTFKIKPAQNQTSLAAGAHVMIGLSNAPSEQNWPQAGFIFQMQKNGYFALYLGNGGVTYVGDGVWNATDKPDNVLNRLRNSSGQEVSLNIGLDDEIKLEIKYMTASERTAYGLQHAGYPAYALLINDCAYYYLPGTDNLFYPCNTAWCGAVENGIAYSYLSVFGNTAGDYNPAIPTPAEIATLSATENVGMRITFSEMVTGILETTCDCCEEYNENCICEKGDVCDRSCSCGSTGCIVAPQKTFTWADWASETKNGANVDVNGETWIVGGMNKDYSRGLDVNGNFVVENVSSEPYFKGGSTKKVLLDGFTTTFKIKPAQNQTTLAAGAHVMIGLSNAPSEQNWPQAGFIFQMQKNGYFALYLGNGGFTYVGDGVWNATDKPDNVLNRLRNSSGQEVSLNIGLDDEIKLEIKYMSAAERAAYGLQHAGYPAYALLINDCAYYYLPGTDNLFYPCNTAWCGAVENGIAYSYLSVFGNTAGDYNPAIPTPSEIATLSATENVGMRITFTDFGIDGTDSGIRKSSAVAREGFTSLNENFYYASVENGVNNGAIAFYKGTEDIAFKANDNVNIGGFSYAVSLKTNALYNVDAQESATFKFVTASKTIEVIATRTDENQLTVTAPAIGEGSVVINNYNFKNGSKIEIGIFAEDSKTVITANGQFVVNEDVVIEKTAEFTFLSNGFERVVETGYIFDGSAQRKVVVTDADVSNLIAVSLEYGETYNNYPESIKLTLEDGSQVDASLAWPQDVVKVDRPGEYYLVGTLTSEMFAQYIVSDEILAKITYSVTVNYPEGYLKYNTEEYKNAGLNDVWFDWANLNQNFIYKNEDGVDHFFSDGFKDNKQYMPVNQIKKDINGFSVDFNFKNHDSNPQPYIVLSLNSGVGHANGGLPILALGFSYTAGRTNIVTFTHNTYEGGQASYVTLVNVENPDDTIYATIDFDWTGNTTYTLSYEVVGEDLCMFLTIGDVKYQAYIGNEAKKVPANLYADEKGYLLVWSQEGYNEIKAKQNFTKYAKAFTKVDDVIVDFGSEHGLSTISKLTLNDGSVVDGVITYAGDYDKFTAGSYTLTGTVSYTGDLVLGNGTTIWEGVSNNTFDVTVIVREEVKTITSITIPEDFAVEIGEQPQFATTLQAQVYSAYTQQTTTETITVSFTSETFNRFVAGTYEFKLTTLGSFVIADGVDTIVNVTVNEEKSEKSGCGSSVTAVAGGLSAIITLCGTMLIKKKKH